MKSLQKPNKQGLGILSFSPDGKMLGYIETTTLNRSVVHIWDTKSWTQIAEFRPLAPPNISQAMFIEFSPDGKTIALFGNNESYTTKSIFLVDWKSQTTWREIAYSGVATLAFSPDGRTLAVANESGTLTLYRVK